MKPSDKLRSIFFVAIVFIPLLWNQPIIQMTHAVSSDSQKIQDRINRVINGLIPEPDFKNQYRPPSKLMDRMAYYHTPGVSIAVINNYQIEWAKGFGILENGKKTPVTEKTLFQAGPISKSIFTLAIMKLAQEGKINLDEDINHTLTSWKVPPKGKWQPCITLRHILSHSAGFPAHDFTGYAVGSKLPTMIDILNGEKPANTPPIQVNLLPGVQFHYSNGGITVAQQLIVDMLHKPFPQIMHDLVIAPMGLKDSTYEQPLPSDRIKQAATGHIEIEGHPIAGKWHIYPEMAAAGLWSTPSDIARIGIELQLAQKGETNKLLLPETVTQMLSPSIDEKTGLGFFLTGKDKNIRFSHTGWDEGFIALSNFYKDTGKGVVIMMNSNEGYPMLEEIERAIAQEYEWPGYFAEEKKAIFLDQKILKSLSGDYITPSGIKMEIIENNKKLFLKLENQPLIELYPESETKFFITDLDIEITFETNKDGTVCALFLEQEDKNPILAQRIHEDWEHIEHGI